jgi:hypothetical protein
MKGCFSHSSLGMFTNLTWWLVLFFFPLRSQKNMKGCSSHYSLGLFTNLTWWLALFFFPFRSQENMKGCSSHSSLGCGFTRLLKTTRKSAKKRLKLRKKIQKSLFLLYFILSFYGTCSCFWTFGREQTSHLCCITWSNRFKGKKL